MLIAVFIRKIILMYLIGFYPSAYRKVVLKLYNTLYYNVKKHRKHFPNFSSQFDAQVQGPNVLQRTTKNIQRNFFSWPSLLK